MGAAAVPAVLAIASTAATVYSSVQAGKAEKKASDRAAERVDAAARIEGEDTAEQQRRVIAKQEARYGASGVTMEGSPLLVKQHSLREAEDQLRRIEEGGSYASETYRKEGSESEKAGNIGALTAGAKGANSIYKSYDWFS